MESPIVDGRSKFDLHPSKRKSSRKLKQLESVTPTEFRTWIEDNDISLYQLSQALDCTWERIKKAMNGDSGTCKLDKNGVLRIPNSMVLAMKAIDSGLLLDEADPEFNKP